MLFYYCGSYGNISLKLVTLNYVLLFIIQQFEVILCIYCGIVKYIGLNIMAFQILQLSSFWPDLLQIFDLV
jgi:hypothetical protein